MRRVTIPAAVFAALFIVCVFTVASQAQDDTMVLNNVKAFGGATQRGPVTYPHAKHVGYGYDCTTCHHKYDPKQPGKNLWTEGDETSCAACHTGPNPAGGLGLKEASHKLCWGCHEKMPESKKLTYGPRSCAGCHTVK